MRRWHGWLRRLAPSFWFATAACAMVAGIEDRHVGDGSATPECEHYCDLVMTHCVGERAVYSSRDTCLGVCALLPVGDPNERTTDNTLACRTVQAELASEVEAADSQAYCRRAGPGGDGYCGDDCESYCALYAGACNDGEPTPEDCEEKCTALRDGKDFDLTLDHEGDSVECRLVHVSSATVDPTDHCAHSRLNSDEWCVDPPTSAPDCDEVCHLIQVACQDDLAVYESEAQCRAVCGALPAGTLGDREENTVGCRAWHAHNALIDPQTHCPHAGPGGDGHCGADEGGVPGNCVSYCTLVAAACAEPFAASFGDDAACVADCAARPASFHAEADSLYSVVDPDPGTLDCRMRAAARAFDDPSECTAALGGADCE